MELVGCCDVRVAEGVGVPAKLDRLKGAFGCFVMKRYYEEQKGKRKSLEYLKFPDYPIDLTCRHYC